MVPLFSNPKNNSPQSVRSLHFTLPRFVLLATLIRGGGGSQAQDHGQAIYAKIRYSVSSTFATGCSDCQVSRGV